MLALFSMRFSSNQRWYFFYTPAHCIVFYHQIIWYSRSLTALSFIIHNITNYSIFESHIKPVQDHAMPMATMLYHLFGIPYRTRDTGTRIRKAAQPATGEKKTLHLVLPPVARGSATFAQPPAIRKTRRDETGRVRSARTAYFAACRARRRRLPWRLRRRPLILLSQATGRTPRRPVRPDPTRCHSLHTASDDTRSRGRGGARAPRYV